MISTRSVAVALAFTWTFSLAAAAQQVQKQDIPGIRNFSRVDATVGCGGATSPLAFTALKQQGFVSIVNLRLASEPGADVETSRTSAQSVGLKYIHLPFDAATPSSSVIDEFIKVVSDKANQPVYIHCGSANRVGALWLAKRLVVDKWPVDKATQEAEAIGLTSPALKQFALDYANRHK